MGDIKNNTCPPLWALQFRAVIYMKYMKYEVYKVVYQILALRCRNNPRPQTNPFFKIQWKIHFLLLLNTDQNAPILLRIVVIYITLRENCFRKWFGTLGSAPIRKHMKLKVQVCRLWKSFPREVFSLSPIYLLF